MTELFDWNAERARLYGAAYAIAPPPPPPDNGAQALVTQGWTQAQTYASDAYDSAVRFLDQLIDVANDVANVPSVTVTLDPSTTQIAPYVAPAVPNDPQNLDMALPAQPGLPDVDAVLEGVRGVLAEWVAGASTGLAPAVEAQIWERARAREHTITERRVRDAYRNFAARGFAKPPGALASEVSAALQEQADKDSTVSRDVAIKQAELEVENRRFAMTQTIAIAQAILQAAEARVRMYMAVVQAEVARVTGQAQVYESRTRAYAAQVQGASTATEATARAYQAESGVKIAEANLRIEALKANVQTLIAKLNVLVESVKGGAQVSAQLAASALSSVNLSGGISASTSESRSASSNNSTSRSQSDSNSYSESHVFQHSSE